MSNHNDGTSDNPSNTAWQKLIIMMSTQPQKHENTPNMKKTWENRPGCFVFTMLHPFCSPMPHAPIFVFQTTTSGPFSGKEQTLRTSPHLADLVLQGPRDAPRGTPPRDPRGPSPPTPTRPWGALRHSTATGRTCSGVSQGRVQLRFRVLGDPRTPGSTTRGSGFCLTFHGTRSVPMLAKPFPFI